MVRVLTEPLENFQNILWLGFSGGPRKNFKFFVNRKIEIFSRARGNPNHKKFENFTRAP